MVNGIAHEQAEWGMRDPVNLIFDQESVRKFPPGAWARMKLAATEEARAFMGVEPTYKNDKTCLPLQAADLWAWWVRKWTLDGDADGIKDLKFPWMVQRRDLFRYNMRFVEQDFRDMIARMLSRRTYMIASHPDPLGLLRFLDSRRALPMTLPDPSSPLNWRK
jgi:hypothetical protein